jgi:hypothetical protein
LSNKNLIEHSPEAFEIDEEETIIRGKIKLLITLHLLNFSLECIGMLI